jgi:hypothetical protein
MARRMTLLATLLAALAVGHVPAGAMEITVTGHQLVLSGPVIGDEFDKVQKVLADDPTIDTAILRNSPGGDAHIGSAGYNPANIHLANVGLPKRKSRSAHRSTTSKP